MAAEGRGCVETRIGFGGNGGRACLATHSCSIRVWELPRNEAAERFLALHSLNQRLNAEDLHHSFWVVSHRVQTYFGADMLDRLHQEMRRAHPEVQCPEHVLNRITALAHRSRIAVDATLHSFAIHHAANRAPRIRTPINSPNMLFSYLRAASTTAS